MNSGPELNFATLMSDIQRIYSTAFYRQLKTEGVNLTRSQWRVIANLKIKQGMTQSELADRLLIEKAPLGTLIDKLEAASLVERRPDPSDRRVKRIFLTASIEPLLPLMIDTAGRLTEQSLAGLSDSDQIELYRMLGQIRHNLQSMRAPQEEERHA